eukprot:TRINITY_DN38402_c0_g1_i1.p1 TRINITY_DN38402_c0_g1~~TRINITY_DN38402_c0_g1_i1.p1  ORF type:complete len:228 (+),score=24.88 TRINITY_DN38402_c0_g1_i1:236-919(+)
MRCALLGQQARLRLDGHSYYGNPEQRYPLFHSRIRASANEPNASSSDAVGTTTTVEDKQPSSKPKSASVKRRPGTGSRGFGVPKTSPSSEASKTGEKVAGVGGVSPASGAGLFSGAETDQGRRERLSGVRRRPAPERPVIAPVASEEEAQVEGAFLVALGLLLSVVFAEGTFLGISGFLPEDLDKIATSVVYPAFTPTVGVFLLVAVAYALFKVKGMPKLPKPPSEE